MRFSLKHHGQLSCIEHCPEGEYVLHTDYARLKAEVERLDTLCKQLGKQYSDISCENIMLRKAGDGLCKSMLEIGCNKMADNLQYDAWWGSIKDWNAAKKGKPQS